MSMLQMVMAKHRCMVLLFSITIGFLVPYSVKVVQDLLDAGADVYAI